MTGYNPAVPTGTVKLNQDYANVQSNFNAMNNAFLINHVPLTQVPYFGFHTILQMVPYSTVASNPPNNYPVTAPAATPVISTLFGAQVNDGIATDETYYFLSGAGRLTQMTRNFQPTISANGATFLPGGLILNWGSKTLLANSSLTTIGFTQTYTDIPYSITLTRYTSDNSTTGQEVRISAGNVTPTQFKVSQSSSSGSNIVYWMAIGK